MRLPWFVLWTCGCAAASPHAAARAIASPLLDDSPDWVETGRTPLRVGGADRWLVDRSWPGEGNGIATPAWVLLELRTEGTTRGYHLDPGQDPCPAQPPVDASEDDVDPCYVPSDTEVEYAELAVDATHVWLVTAATEDPPTRACYVPAR